MIRDDRHHRMAQAQAIGLRVALARIDAPPAAKADTRPQDLDAMRAQLEVLERELREYETRHERR